MFLVMSTHLQNMTLVMYLGMDMYIRIISIIGVLFPFEILDVRFLYPAVSRVLM